MDKESMVIILLVILVLYASPLSAACTWVLWSHHGETTEVDIPVSQARWTGQLWTPVKPYETQQQCETSLRSEVRWIQSPGYAESNGYKSAGRDENSARFFQMRMEEVVKFIKIEYSCWPDTIDPRKR